MTRLRLVQRPEANVVRATFADLYRDHFDFVWRVLARLGVPERDLPDAAQDVFMVVHKKLPEFEWQCRPTTWLYGIGFRVASARRRAAPSRREVLGDLLPEPASECSEARVADTAHYRRLLAEALDRMPLEQRAAFAFFELDGLTAAQIAEDAGVSEATIHSRLRLAREIFRRFVARLGAREAFDPGAEGGER
ncbi:MAG TPA: sigma-70 family RNA polymerase sigma factor [Polyangiaceae bacterium]|nr:sigma-70 family RNA polymerase sigma factor [Polyangiaceae bacterium]